jgi:hypothetical protein
MIQVALINCEPRIRVSPEERIHVALVVAIVLANKVYFDLWKFRGRATGSLKHVPWVFRERNSSFYPHGPPPRFYKVYSVDWLLQ